MRGQRSRRKRASGRKCHHERRDLAGTKPATTSSISGSLGENGEPGAPKRRFGQQSAAEIDFLPTASLVWQFAALECAQDGGPSKPIWDTSHAAAAEMGDCGIPLWVRVYRVVGVDPAPGGDRHKTRAPDLA